MTDKRPAAHQRAAAYLAVHRSSPAHAVVECDEHPFSTEDLADLLHSASRQYAVCNCRMAGELPEREHDPRCPVYVWWAS